ncbi:helix-turn-helix domain-containing protein [Thiobacillus denitrificans]|uniref:helix-turn-helix domain-containing protein n=1 Tax=Thiobacillus denitrificans TaxID=36861 RepID=UPI000371F19E|nr:helix-turn-helix transcriptional regulator [Thiobacillus denitrificans]
MEDQGTTTLDKASLDGLGARLALAILHLGISQSEFARRLGSSPGFVSDVVRRVKKPGAEFLFGIKQTFGISADWLLSGTGTMHGGGGINLDLLRTIRLQVSVAKAAIVQGDPTAKALLLLIRDGRLAEAGNEPELRTYLDRLCPEDPDRDLADELYNGHLWTDDPATQQRNLLAAAVAYFEARKPLDKLAALSRAQESRVQINISPNQRIAGRDYHEK